MLRAQEKQMWQWDIRQNLQQRCRKKENRFTRSKENRIQKIRSWIELERRGWGTEESGQIQCPYGTEFLVVSAYKCWTHLTVSWKEL